MWNGVSGVCVDHGVCAGARAAARGLANEDLPQQGDLLFQWEAHQIFASDYTDNSACTHEQVGTKMSWVQTRWGSRTCAFSCAGRKFDFFLHLTSTYFMNCHAVSVPNDTTTRSMYQRLPISFCLQSTAWSRGNGQTETRRSTCNILHSRLATAPISMWKHVHELQSAAWARTYRLRTSTTGRCLHTPHNTQAFILKSKQGAPRLLHGELRCKMHCLPKNQCSDFSATRKLSSTAF